jgi:hypothetical protein
MNIETGKKPFLLVEIRYEKSFHKKKIKKQSLL